MPGLIDRSFWSALPLSAPLAAGDLRLQVHHCLSGGCRAGAVAGMRSAGTYGSASGVIFAHVASMNPAVRCGRPQSGTSQAEPVAALHAQHGVEKAGHACCQGRTGLLPHLVSVAGSGRAEHDICTYSS
ncbi:MAG: hypothetical protein KDI75_11585 [Xanthomonadales bacterium]|nr:hypothetical protein [Xanthomonadales bacterium]